ncbi:MAG: hypothetical protein FWB83_05165 [Treponema sp.]|nr:hypothetical protein [Treponema sp.]
MKRLLVFTLIAVLVTGVVSAQAVRDQRDGRQENTQRTEPQRINNQRENARVTIEGSLKLDRGFVAVESGDTVYIVPMLNQYIGFINGMREGESISVEGFRIRNIIQPLNVTLDGRTYVFTPPRPQNSNIQPFWGNQNQRQERNQFTPNRDRFPNRNNAPNRGQGSNRNDRGCDCGRR